MKTPRGTSLFKITSMVLASMLVLVLVLSLAACGEDFGAGTIPGTPTSETTTLTTAPEGATSTTEPPTSSTTAASATTTTEPLSSAETRLPSGNIKAMGFIDQIRFDGTRNYIRIDYAELLTGEAAREAAIAAGFIAPGEELDTDYFISNVNPQRREFQVSDTVAITTSTFGGVMERPISWDEFRSYWSATPPSGTAYLRDMPWWIERDGDVIVRIDEQYLP